MRKTPMGYISSLRNNVLKGAFLTVTATLFVAGFSVLNINSALARTDTTLTVSPVTATYGDTISLSATLTLKAGESALSGKTIDFNIRDNHHDAPYVSVGSADTDANGTATLNNVNIIGFDAGSDDNGVYAKFNGDGTYDPDNDKAKLIINKKSLTVSGITANNKVYDRNTTATLNTANAILVGVLAGDTVNLDKSGVKGEFSDRDVGAGKIVTIADLDIIGNHPNHDDNNYTLTQPTATADITPKTLTVNSDGLIPSSKVYDGTTNTTLTIGSPSLNGIIHNDTVTINATGATGAFSDKNVENGKTVQISGLILGGSDSGNYALTQPTRTANITMRAITITSDPKSKPYSDPEPVLTYQITSGSLVAGDSLSGELSRVAGENVGVYAIQQGTLTNSNYAITYVAANLTITKATPTITWSNPLNIVYGTPLDLVNHLNAAVAAIFGNFAYNPAAGAILDAGENQTLSTIFTPDDAINYGQANKNVSITVDKRPLTVLAAAGSKIYDGTNDATVTLSDDRLAGDDLAVNYANANFTDPNVGGGKTVTVNNIVVTGLDSGNYSLASGTVSTTADISPRPLTIIANSINKFFGQELILVGTKFTTSGLVKADSVTNVALNSAGTAVDAPVNTYAIIPSNAGGVGVSNYDITYVNGVLTVNEKLNPIITWPNLADITYGTALSSTQLNATAAFDGNPVDGAFAAFVYAPSEGAVLAAGDSQDLSVEFFPNDTDTYNNVSAYVKINVLKSPITITADVQAKIYGEIDPDLTYQITSGSLVAGDSLSGELNRVAGENVGVYAIQQGTLSAGSNYDLTFAGANLTITPKSLTITANDGNKTVEQTLIFAGTEFAITGDLVSGDSVTSVTLTSTGADALAVNGVYDIVPSLPIGTGVNNYAIIYVNGVLTVNEKLNPVITWLNPADITYGTALDSIQLNATALNGEIPVEGTFVYAPAEGTILAIGNEQQLSVEFTPTDAVHYNSATVSASINVINPVVPLTIVGSSGGGGGGYTPITPTTDNGIVSPTFDRGGMTSIIAPDGAKITLTIPPGTVLTGATFTIAPVSPENLQQGDFTNKKLIMVGGYVYSITASDSGGAITTFSNPLTITFTYSDSQINGLDENSLKMYFWDTAKSEWVVADTQINKDTNELTVSVNHLTVFSMTGTALSQQPVVEIQPTTPIILQEIVQSIPPVVSVETEIQPNASEEGEVNSIPEVVANLETNPAANTGNLYEATKNSTLLGSLAAFGGRIVDSNIIRYLVVLLGLALVFFLGREAYARIKKGKRLQK